VTPSGNTIDALIDEYLYVKYVRCVWTAEVVASEVIV
jgi:hypothetical protein